MDRIYPKIPKIELHAHLSGSVSHTTLRRLQNFGDGTVPVSLPTLDGIDKSNIHECFALFKVVHQTLQSPAVVEQATTDVIEEFAEDGVVYLELRTTLRPLPTRRDYLDAVIRGINSASSRSNGRIDVRLLSSIDRTLGLDVALEVVDLTIEYKNRWPGLILGVDLSGNPDFGTLLDFVPALERARAHGIKTTVHLAELPNQGREWFEFLTVHMPDRIGHGTFLSNSGGITDPYASKARSLIQQARIPIEICLTSNVKTETVADYRSHHLLYWLQLGHPVCICTDDKGVFSCTLSSELKQAVNLCGVSMSQLYQMTAWSIDAAFCSEADKRKMHEQLTAFQAENPEIFTKISEV
ncbi:unnamed protein product [Calicophoron daubneyi]|uniref:Adenosine deaminase domain-containing protein n=1 Tax=Calicophoron daubneyi TaxID=300641 RepID=A0AAV2TZJ6_CALDB